MTQKDDFQFVLPDPKSVLEYVHDTITTQLRENAAEPGVTLPNLYQRAKILVEKTGVLIFHRTRSKD